MAADDSRIVRGPELDLTINPGGLGCTLFEKMLEHQENLAQIDGLTGEQETYKSLLQRCIRTALTMRSKGLKQGDIINICSITKMDVCVPLIAAIFLGVKPSTLDPTLSLHDIIHLYKQIKPQMVFVGPEVVENIEKALKEASVESEIVVFGNTPIHTPFADFLQPNPEEGEFKPVAAKSLTDTAVILFSSGTSGLPKGICLNHSNFLVAFYQSGKILQQKRMLTFASFYWISTVGSLVGSILCGSSRIVVPRFELEGIWELLDTYKPTMTFLAPSYAAAITRTKRPETIKSLALDTIIISGGPISEKHARGLQQIIPEATVLFSYAQTEATGLITIFKPNIPQEKAWAAAKPTCSGTVLPGASIKIVDTETEELLGPNQRGELRLKSKCVMNGYYNIDSSDAWDSDGWLRTGDIAYYDQDRCFYVVDRVKEMFKCRAFHVAPAVVEAVVLQHPAVEGAVVIGIPHEEDGDHPMALVVLSKGAKVVPEDIVKFVEERVSDVQRLRAGVKFIDVIPRTPTGKVKRRDLRDQVLRGEI